MTPRPDPNNLRLLFDAVVDLPPEQRRRHLDEFCPDWQLRQKVERLLAADAVGGASSNPPASGASLEGTRLDEGAAAASGPEDPAPVAIGGYRILKELGRGSYGVVYLGHDDALDRLVAIKIPHADLIRATRKVETYIKEARALANLRHPNIISVYEAKTTGEHSCYIVCQYVAGRTLDVRLAEGRLSHVEAAQLLATLADALQHAHEKGIIHRDVKPANILLSADGTPYLADLGLALKEEEIGTGPHLLGTPAYMSPEQARGEGHQVDGRTDIYSLGAVFFELLTGKRPFPTESRADLLHLIANADPPTPQQKDRTVPAELDRICARTLARRVQDRYSSASALADDLNAWLASQAVRAGDQPPKAPRVVEGRSIGGFELRSLLGSGGMGIVYRAWHPSERREVALKCLPFGDATARTRFMTEIQALGRVEHPNLVRIYTSGADNRQLYYAMELINGANFKAIYHELQRRNGEIDDDAWSTVLRTAADETRARELPLGSAAGGAARAPQPDNGAGFDYLEVAPTCVCESASYVRRVVTIVRQVADAAQALHERDVIHRDIKPDNIMLTRDGRAVLMDLGIAKFGRGGDGRLTRTREFVGSLRYASPEQVLDAGHVDHRSDIYSLGVTLWELLTLRPIYGLGRDARDSQAMLKIEIEEPETVRKYNRAAPTDLQAIVQKCLEKHPNRRYSSAASLGEDLGRFLQGQPVQARPVGTVTRVWRRCRRRPLVPALSAALAVMTVVLAFLAFLPDQVPASDPDRLTVGLWDYTGYAPLVVAARMNLCDGLALRVENVESIKGAREKHIKGEIDASVCVVDSHLHTRDAGIKTRVVLKLATSHGADGIVVRAGIEFLADLEGKQVAFVKQEPPHFLMLALAQKEKKPFDMAKVIWIETDADKAAQMFIDDGKIAAAVTWEPHLSRAAKGGTGRILRTSAHVKDTIVDILTVDEKYLKERPHNVAKLIDGWFQAVAKLKPGHPEREQAIKYVCEFFQWSRQEYDDLSPLAPYADRAENVRFFQPNEESSSEFRKLMLNAQERWNSERSVTQKLKINPQDTDGSALLLKSKGSSQK